MKLIDLGLASDCQLTKRPEGGWKVKMTLTALDRGMDPAIAYDAQSKILSIDGVDERMSSSFGIRHGTKT